MTAPARPRSAWRPIARAVLAVTLLNGGLTFLFGPPESFADWEHTHAYAEVARHAVVEHGEGPWWNPVLCGGVPALAHPQSRILTPFFLLHLLLGVPLALKLEVVLHTAIGALGAALLAREWIPEAAGEAPAAVAALGFTGSTAFTLHVAAGHPWILGAAWAPWVLWATRRAGQGDLRFAAAGGVALALMIGEGAIYPAPMTGLFAAGIALELAVRRRSVRPLLALGLLGLLGVLLAAPKVVPMLDYITEVPRRLASTESLTLGQLATALLSPTQGLGRPFEWVRPWHEVGSYVGVLQAVLAVLGLVWARRRVGVLGAAVLLFAALALGHFAGWAPWALLHRLPPF
ncbi:MAG: hypothetical protein R3263_09720, partial [Myxococcota bacterium]|nr:hypothetical protein [Myxococcota bacterium]